jgi:hypothetical protein
MADLRAWSKCSSEVGRVGDFSIGKCLGRRLIATAIDIDFPLLLVRLPAMDRQSSFYVVVDLATLQSQKSRRVWPFTSAAAISPGPRKRKQDMVMGESPELLLMGRKGA